MVRNINRGRRDIIGNMENIEGDLRNFEREDYRNVMATCIHMAIGLSIFYFIGILLLVYPIL